MLRVAWWTMVLLQLFFTRTRFSPWGSTFPLSPYSSNWNSIRQNQAIRGISIENEETKILQFADDTAAVLSDISSAEQLFELLNFFRDISGLTINCKRTESMWIGSTKENKAKPLGMRWPNEPIKALGVYYTYDVKLLRIKNFIARLHSQKTYHYLVLKWGVSFYVESIVSWQ